LLGHLEACAVALNEADLSISARRVKLPVLHGMFPSPYYEIRMEYKRDHAGNLLEISGCEADSVDALRTLFATIFKNHDSINCRKQIVLPGTSDIFVSFECPLQGLGSETDFDTVCISELCPAGADHVSGILSLDMKRCNSGQVKPPDPKMLKLIGMLQQKALLMDQARYGQMSCNDRVRQWLSTVCPSSGYHTQDDPSQEFESGISTDSSRILEDPDEELLRLDFSEYYALILLSQNGRVPPSQPTGKAEVQSCPNQDGNRVVHEFTSLFDQRLRSVAPDGDKWGLEGRQFFIGKIEFFVLRGRPIECCLPAFPCKSSNLDKVASRSPDGAEYEALANLFRFCNEVKQFYKPGCRITIVSDGHVFSDCIGVDDNRVSAYTQKLLQMCRSISSQFTSMSGLCSPISFKNLHNLFLDDRALLPLFQESYISACQLKHFVDTELNPQDEKCRKLLMLSAQSDANNIVACIKSKYENSLTSLFRGFSKFMFEDLAHHPVTEHLSKSQRKKLSEKIAFEMIQRNQAYSHLVEQIFPHFVRFSIHAHRNSGPKFGIKLLPSDRFKHLTSFSELGKSDILDIGDAKSERKHLHIPTPWHNSLLEIKGSPYSYVCKAAVVREELSSPETKWEGGCFPSPRGERWIVTPKSRKQERKERKQRERQEQQIQLHEQIEKETEQIKQDRQNVQLLKQMEKHLRDELDRARDECWSRACDAIDHTIAQGAELSDSSRHSGEQDDGVLPEWIDDLSECTSFDFDLWKHVNGESGAVAWIQVPFNEVQIDCAMKSHCVRDNMYTATHSYPELPSMAMGTISGSHFMGTNWLEIPEHLKSPKSSSGRTRNKSPDETNSTADSPKPRERESFGKCLDKHGITYECVGGRMVTQPNPTKNVAAGGPDDLYGVSEEECNCSRSGRKPLNANARAFTPRNPNSGRSPDSEGLLGVSGATNGEDSFNSPPQTDRSGVQIVSAQNNMSTGNGPSANTKQWSLVEDANSPIDSDRHMVSVPSRGRSNTNPSEFDFNQLGPRDLEAIFNSAMSTYQRDIGRLSILASELKTGCRREVGNGTSHGQEYVCQISFTAAKEKFALEECQVSPNQPGLRAGLKANIAQEQTTRPLPAPCIELEAAWQDGNISEAIVSSHSTSAAESDVRR